MLTCRSSCLISSSQLSKPSTISELSIQDDSCEVVVSYKLDSLYSGRQNDEENGSIRSYGSNDAGDYNLFADDEDITPINTPTRFTSEHGQHPNLSELKTPQKCDIPSWKSITSQLNIPIDSAGAPFGTSQLFKNGDCDVMLDPLLSFSSEDLCLPKDVSNMDNVQNKVKIDGFELDLPSDDSDITVDISAIHDQIVSRILDNAEQRCKTVTFCTTYDNDEISESDFVEYPCEQSISSLEVSASNVPKEHSQERCLSMNNVNICESTGQYVDNGCLVEIKSNPDDCSQIVEYDNSSKLTYSVTEGSLVTNIKLSSVETHEIEGFKNAIKFNKMKELMSRSFPFTESDKKCSNVESSSSDSLQQGGRNRFKVSPKRIIDEESIIPDAPNQLQTSIGTSQYVENVDFEFLKKRKRDRSERDKHLSDSQSHPESNAGHDTTIINHDAVNSRVQRSSNNYRRNRNVEPRERSRPVMKDDSYGCLSGDDTTMVAYKDLSIGLNTSSLGRSLYSSGRNELSSSFHREASPNRETVSKRGKLSDTYNSTGSSKSTKAHRKKPVGDKVFAAEVFENKDWSSETWGSFINVINSRKRTLGHGSFSTVSFAFLRLTPSLTIQSTGSNGSNAPSSSRSKDSLFAETSQLDFSDKDAMDNDSHMEGSSDRTTVGSSSNASPRGDDSGNISEQGCSISSDIVGSQEAPANDSAQPSGAVSSNDGFIDSGGDIVDWMCSIIAKHCNKCAKVRTLDCAVKSINDVFWQARFQYIREKEMMLHFHANVLKPIACRFHTEEGTRVYQLLLPKAQGDLLDMLKHLIKYRTLNNRNPIYISNQSTGKQERKIIGLSETEVKFLFFQILSGLSFIHMCFQGNIHRHSDIKLQNILVFCSESDRHNPLRWRLCLADFGCSIMLHPTQHLEGAGLFKHLQDTVSKEWRSQLCSQLTSFVRGTVRCNAPEALSYDRHGTPRSNRNNNMLMWHKRNLLNMDATSEDNPTEPVAWAKKDISSKISYHSPRNTGRLVGASDGDPAEYFHVNRNADMWSAGIVLAELAKFGGCVPLDDVNIDEKYLTKSGDDALSAEYIAQRLNGTLGRGLFCRNNAVVRLKMQLDSPRDKSSPRYLKRNIVGDKGKNKQGALTDECLNMALASDIAAKCDLDYAMRIRNLKRDYFWWEYPRFSDNFWNMLANLLAYKPQERLTAVAALGHPWFNSNDGNSRPIFDDIDALITEQHKHLPMEHFYYVGSSLSLQNGNKKSQMNPEVSGADMKREAMMDPLNSDIVLESIGCYGKAGRSTHAWYSGPLHYRLATLKEHGIAIPDYIAQICRRETLVLESREKELFGSRGFVLSKLLSIKREHNMTWEDLMSSRVTHLLGCSILKHSKAQF
ncbi:Protein kinase domain family protein [Babesia bovis T2Bo]|uniref:Protein kinase domain containing protein n=1 Tax=Babesia bovis TaxID=5865 RepID=A7ASA3_BABBO|nr:Protein kinase domain family protein [Babesia bovis T2Bo]EDO07422.1 Protein kinase domain family protein [Babesia bovis T2Bo]|eukprot:XP_001610990.1 protein kinase domain containing protein [Babesia bovis T2Bo]